MKNRTKLKRFFATLRMTSKRTAFTLAEVAEPRQHGSHQELSAMAKVEPEARQYAPSPLEGEGWGEGFRKRAAFTLAEVLITLGVIGIVAAMTIPTLIQNHQKKVTAVKLQQTYSILNNAIKMAQVENGDVASWDIFGANGGKTTHYDGYKQVNEKFVQTFILPYVKVVKIYGTVPLKNVGISKYYYHDGSIYVNGDYYLWYFVKLNNGVMLIFGMNGKGDCSIDDNGTIGWCLSSPFVFIDVNGEKEPNTSGKDFFMLTFNKAKNIYWFGDSTDREHLKNTCKTENSLNLCGRLIQLDGWTIKDDYPW